jgi:hypothetical protein
MVSGNGIGVAPGARGPGFAGGAVSVKRRQSNGYGNVGNALINSRY